MGNLNGDGLGEFFCVDAETLEAKGTWTRGHIKANFGYDFWYQPYHDTLVASEWGAPRVFQKGFIPEDIYNPSKFSIACNFMTRYFMEESIYRNIKYHLLICRDLWQKLELLFME